MAKNGAARKYPAVPPATCGPRAPHAAEIVALMPGGPPYAAPLKDRGRVAQLVRYWGRTLGAQFKTRKFGREVVVWRVA